MQHEPLEFRHLLEGDTVRRFEMREIPQHPLQRIAELAVGIDCRLQNFRTDALIVPIIGRAGP
jgi:hypothetical protein